MITVLGLGPMGQALARAFVAAGRPTTVWSRSETTPTPAGAIRAATPAAAVEGSELAIVCVRGEEALRTVLDPIGGGHTVVNVTSGTPALARELVTWAADRGVELLNGAIMTPAPSIGTPAAVVLYSGSQSLYEKWADTLATLGGTASYLGEDPGRAAAFDIALLDMFWQSVSGIVHGLALARAEGITGADLAPYGRSITGMLSNMVSRFAEQLDKGEFPGTVSTIASAEASLDHITETAEGHGIDARALRAGLDLVRRAIADGHGGDGLGRLADVLSVTGS